MHASGFRAVGRACAGSIFIASLVLGGCALGKTAPGYVECKGKGVITGSGAVGAGLGGGNVFTLNVDCGDGVMFRQGPVPGLEP